MNFYLLLTQQQKTALMRNNSALQNVTLRTKSELSETHSSLNLLTFVVPYPPPPHPTHYTTLHTIFSLLIFLLSSIIKLLPHTSGYTLSTFPFLFTFCVSCFLKMYSIAPGVRERPSSAIYPSDSFRQSLLGSRRGRSSLTLSKSVSTNNIAG